jgi:hypothetical protein
MGLFKSMILFFGRKTKSPVLQRVPISTIASELQKSISKCETTAQLEACETYFRKMISVYSDDASLQVFRHTIRTYLNIQTQYIKTKKPIVNEPSIN